MKTVIQWMRRRLFWTIILCLCLFPGHALWQTVTRIIYGPPVGYGLQPYTATLQQTVFDSQGRRTLVCYDIYAQWTDSSSARWTKLNEQDVEEGYILRGSGTEIYFHVPWGVQMSRSVKYGRSLRHPEKSCLKGGERVVGFDRIGQYRAVRVSGLAGRISWYALDVGCAPLKALDAHSRGRSETKLMSLRIGVPDRALLSPPEGLLEVPPSLYNCPERIPGKVKVKSAAAACACSEATFAARKKQDEYYYAHRPNDL